MYINLFPCNTVGTTHIYIHIYIHTLVIQSDKLTKTMGKAPSPVQSYIGSSLFSTEKLYSPLFTPDGEL